MSTKNPVLAPSRHRFTERLRTGGRRAARPRLLASLLALSSTVAASSCADSPGGSVSVDDTSSALCACITPAIDASRSLLVTDASALAPFSLQAVLDQLRASASATGQTSLQLYRQWWDLNNDAAHAQTGGAHCDDQKNSSGQATVNGFPIECPRQEGVLAATNPFQLTSPDSYVPVALVNRFDLAKSDGSDCGEYRVIFGKKSGQSSSPIPGTDRNLLIFEASLPNPAPSAGVAGCAAIARFWAGLSTDASASSRASKLQQFYFSGVTEACSGTQIAPVLHYEHFAGGGHGQVRTNQFMNSRDYFGQGALGQPWELREYFLTRACTSAGACTLAMRLDSVKTNPYGPLFAATTGGSDLTAMQQDFVDNQVARLIASSVSAIAMQTPDAYNAGESKAQTSENDYQSQAAGNTVLQSAIQAKLTSLLSSLTPTQVLDRATTQSCGGCHQLSNRKALGGGLIWPASNGFTHVDEQSGLSNALTRQFLPHRAQVLSDYLTSSCSGTSPLSSSGGAGTLGGSVTH